MEHRTCRNCDLSDECRWRYISGHACSAWMPSRRSGGVVGLLVLAVMLWVVIAASAWFFSHIKIMPIEFKRAYVSGNKTYATLEEAQTAEIQAIIDDDGEKSPAELIVKNKAQVINILTLNDSSRPKARGVPKRRKAKTDEAPAQPELAPPPAE